ncbi:nucleoside-diphosphate-sugar epimerase [Friedmanniella endophytica]|uniref:Nucleoside-diphosphate-sugar epimerase n=1 Tax=Microlunatus kandeliicorticis TaxID=1759536 RepID=A0A7W3P621_9ACTN|nr:NAD(P)-dependent oxidoreductase [Microlunatus kandeliicorticis]MBA8794475.1 nucleoside-diphosphate-sugar epimerase [Microlunatus kandeliicorticis]
MLAADGAPEPLTGGSVPLTGGSVPLTGRAVLVTGAAGTIGGEVCRRFTEGGARVTALIMEHQEPPTFPTGDPAYERVVRGDTTDRELVGEAVDGAAAVVHLAAYISPTAAPPYDVFVNNVASTFTVLFQAGEHEVPRAVLASSINASGLPMNSHDVAVDHYPVDEDLPVDIEDPYSLSKQTDEGTARMISRRFPMPTVAFRFPLTTTRARLLEFGALDPGKPSAVREGWSYLDVRDAARAVELAVTRPVSGAHAVLVAADDVRVPHATEDLLDAYAPGVPRRRRFVGTEVPVDLGRCRSLLGFRAEHTLDLEPGPLPGS